MRPGAGLVRLLAALFALGVVTALVPALSLVWSLAALAILTLAAIAVASLQRVPPLAVERQVAGILPLGVFSDVTLRVTNPGTSSIDVEVFDSYPRTAELDGLPRRLTVPAQGQVEVDYRIRPRERGLVHFDRTELLLRSPFDLFRRRVFAPESRAVRVVPNVRAVARFALLAAQDQLGQAGVRIGQKRGEGMEFDELREYRPADSLRRIDWKATARRQKLISRQYQEEKNQQVTFLIDCGRRLRAHDGDLSHFDHVLNAVLLLTYVALRQGDAVGFFAFSGERRFLQPTKGPAGMETVLRALYDLETTTSPSDYLEGATRLMARQRRRSLVILVTNLRDEDSSEIGQALRLLKSRHLVLLASLQEAILGESLARPIETVGDAVRTAATHHYLGARKALLDQLRATGVLTLDVTPDALPLKLVNRYLGIKRGGLL